MKNKFFIALVLTCLICMQAWVLYITFHYAYYGVKLQTNAQHEWTIKSFDTDRIKSNLGLQVGDTIIKVNGKDPNEYVIVTKWRQLERADTITVSRNSIEFEVDMKNKVQFTFDFLSLFGEILSLCIAFLIYLKIPNSKSARFLSYVFIISGIIFMSIPASSRLDTLGMFLVNNLVIGYPIVFLHFLTLFFKEKCRIQLPLKYVYGLYGIAVIHFIQSVSFFTPYLTYSIHRFQFNFLLFGFLIGLLANPLMFVYVYFRYRRENESIQSIIKVVGFAFFVSCAPLAFLSFVPMLLYQKAIVEPIYTSWFVILFPISFTYLIVTKQLFDIQIIVRRILYTTIISMIPSAIIVGLLALIFNKETTFTKLAFSFFFIVTIISFLLYLLEYFVIKLDVIMFPRKYHLQMALKKISQNLGTIKTFRELNDIILVDIVNTLQVYGGAIVFKYQNAIETIGEGDIDLEEIEQCFVDGTIDDSTYSVFEINQHEEYASYLITTKKKTNTLLGMEETQWLNLIISYLAVSLENLYLIRKLTMKLHELATQIPNEQAGQDFVWLRKSLFELQERERFRIATDLHDTTMQDILLIRTRLISFIEHNEEPQELFGVIKHLELVNESLRQSCFELNPYLLQRIGLIKTIEAAIDLDIGINEFETHFSTEGAETIESIGIEIKKHLFRMIQELIHNAKKHSKASKVSIKLAVMNDYICLFYKDNGVGMDIKALEEDDRLSKVANSGLGLEQMKSRIVHLNGHVELESKRGNGVKLTVRIPMQKEVAV